MIRNIDTTSPQAITATAHVQAGDPSTIGGDGDGSLLPSVGTTFATNGDIGAEVAALIIKSANAQRQTARDAERLQGDMLDREEEAKVAEMRQKAEDTYSEGLCSAVTQFATAGLELVNVDQQLLTGSKSAGIEVTGKLVGAEGGLWATSYKSAQQRDDARIAQHTHTAEQAKRALEAAGEDVKDARKLANDAIEFYREYTTAQNQAKKAAIHGA